KVTAVGEGSRTKSGTRIKPDVKKGDTVLFGKYAGSDIQIDGEEYKIVRENEILAKLGS
ncbi:MAG: co-chaperone GroES, partial [Planctomycetota bacterium]